MSQGKFASITSSLLARKGEAAPWDQNGRAPLAWRSDAAAPPLMTAVPRPVLLPHPVPVPQQDPAPPPPPPGAIKRCSVRLSQQEYERLGLMAVKKNVTRQQLLQAALNDALAGMARELSRNCACIGQGSGKSCGQGCSDQM